MKRIFFVVFVWLMFIFIPIIHADRDTATVTTYRASQLVQRGDAKVYSATFVASANGGDFILYDAVDLNFAAGTELDSIQAEGSEVTALGGHFQDFSDKPLEFSTGLYIIVNDGYLTLRYE